MKHRDLQLMAMVDPDRLYRSRLEKSQQAENDPPSLNVVCI